MPGKIKLYPFQKGIADAIGDATIERVSVLKSARIGYTTILNGAIAHFVVNDPSLILAYLPTEDMAKSFVVSDMEPTFEDSPALQGVLSGDQVVTAGKKRTYHRGGSHEPNVTCSALGTSPLFFVSLAASPQ